VGIVDYLNMKWYAAVDDVVGGWAVAPVNEPVSAFLGYGDGRAVADGFFEKEHADHVVELHNDWLANREEDENE
jgi:hypothetical protein